MDKTNGWQTSAIIGIIGFIGSIVYSLEAESFTVAIVGCVSIFILCMFIHGIGTLIEQNDIIIEFLNNSSKK